MTTPTTPVTAPSRRRFGLPALILVALSSAGAGGLTTHWLARRTESAAAAAPREAARAPLYTCPMHPSIVLDHPGNCPICGMKLVELESSESHADSAASAASEPRAEAAGVPGLAVVEIDADRQQLIGLKTAAVESGPVGGAWRTVGRVAIDERRVRHINLKVSGFVERIYADFVGKSVQAGDPLFSLYSPELLATQEEYLLALKTRAALHEAGGASDDGADLVASARRKLMLWDVAASDVEAIERTGQPAKALTFYSPVAGVVTKKDIVQGMKLDAGAMPYEIVDLSSVWVLADVYESELRFVQEGMAATLELNAFPNRVFKGRVVFVDPLLDPRTRTVKVRLNFPNPSGELRPEMFGEVTLRGAPRAALRVPSDAVIDSGTEKVVFVASGAGKFEPRKVAQGVSDGQHVEITHGLALGERVVTRANFLVDSESRLRASLAQMAVRPSGAREGPESARVLPGAGSPSPARETEPAPAERVPAGEHQGHRP
jgi:membrane fusion protein, copper/silver efflux system